MVRIGKTNIRSLCVVKEELLKFITTFSQDSLVEEPQGVNQNIYINSAVRCALDVDDKYMFRCWIYTYCYYQYMEINHLDLVESAIIKNTKLILRSERSVLVLLFYSSKAMTYFSISRVNQPI